MENNEILWIVFFGIMCLLVLLILVFLLADAIKTNKKLKNGGEPIINVYIDKDGSARTENQELAGANTLKSENVVNSNAENVDVRILKAKPKLLFQDELAASSQATKEDEAMVIKHFEELDENVRIIKSNYHVLIKYGSYNLCKLAFTRGILKANFFVASSEFKLYSKTMSGVAVKEKPTSVFLNNPDALPICYELADLAFHQAKRAKAERAKSGLKGTK